MKNQTFWSIPIIVFLFVLLLTPLIVAESLYFPFVTGKVFTFRILVAVALVGWLILVTRKPEFLPRKSSILAVSGLFVLWMAVTNALGLDWYNSFFSNFERMEGWFTHLFLFGYLVVVSSVIRTERLWHWLFGVSLATANVVALYGAFDAETRTSSLLGNPTYVAVYLMFNLFFAALLALRTWRNKATDSALKYMALIYYALSAVLLVYLIFRTQTRGTILALFFSSLLFMVLSALMHWNNRKVRIVSIALLVCAIAGATTFWIYRDAAFIQNNPMLARVTTISPTEGTGRARVINWGIAVDAIKDRPLIGWGQENYIYVFPMFYDPQMYNQEAWFDRTHNAVLDWAIQGGVPASLFYLSLFVLPLIAVWKSTTLTRTEKSLLTSLFAAYGIHNTFVFDNYSSYLMFFMLLAFVMHHENKGAVVLGWNERIRQVVAGVLIVLVLVVSYVVSIKPLSVAKGIIDALQSKGPGEMLDRYDAIFAKKTFGEFEAATRLFSDAGTFVKIEDPEIRNRYISMGTAAGEKMIADNPDSLRALEFYGTFLIQVGNPGKAIELLEQAREISPDRQHNLYMLAFAYVNNKQLDKATEILKHAYEVAPENQRAKNYYGALLVLKGDPAGKELVEGYSYRDSFFLSVFTAARQYAEVIRILEQQIAEQPTNYQLRVSLAFAHFQNGNKTKAIEILRGIIAEVPAFKTQGETFIKEIQSGKMPAK